MPSSVKISVIVPVYNVEKYLPTCLQSLVAQAFADMEIVAVNDGSTDGSLSVLQTFAKQYPFLQVISQENQGVAAARQAGIKQARGQAVCFVDSDDVLTPGYLEELWRVYENTGAKMVVGPLVRFPGKSPDSLTSLFERGCLCGADRISLFDDFSAAMALCGKLIHRSCLPDLKFPTARTGDDILPSVTLIANCDPIALAPKAVYFYRERTNSQSRAGDGRFEGILAGFVQARRHLKEQGVYADFAPGFEYICRVCLTSFIEKYGLNAREEKALADVAKETWVPLSVFAQRNRRFRWRQRLFNACLKYGFSYSRLWRFIHLFYGKGARGLKWFLSHCRSPL